MKYIWCLKIWMNECNFVKYCFVLYSCIFIYVYWFVFLVLGIFIFWVVVFEIVKCGFLSEDYWVKNESVMIMYFGSVGFVLFLKLE